MEGTVIATTRYIILVSTVFDFFVGRGRSYDLGFTAWIGLLFKTFLFGFLAVASAVFVVLLLRTE